MFKDMEIYLENNFKLDFNLENLKNKLGNDRYQHTMLVLKAALQLAEQLNVEIKKVIKAALLHDIAKSKNEKELETILKNSKWKLDKLEAELVPVLHAPAGAVIAEKEYNIIDEDVLEAIRYHTLGHPEMGITAQIIYAADFISEDRSFDGLDKIRAEIKEDFYYGLYLITTHIINYQLGQGNIIHPYSNDLRNKLLKRSDL